MTEKQDSISFIHQDLKKEMEKDGETFPKQLLKITKKGDKFDLQNSRGEARAVKARGTTRCTTR